MKKIYNVYFNFGGPDGSGHDTFISVLTESPEEAVKAGIAKLSEGLPINWDQYFLRVETARSWGHRSTCYNPIVWDPEEKKTINYPTEETFQF